MASAQTGSDERLAGLLLMGAAAAALILANSLLAEDYFAILHAKLGPLTVHSWIADALMAVFFLLVGLEVKREWYDGQLCGAQARRLPIIAAVAGMAVPALVYVIVTGGDPMLMKGWAIPAATDIAFALGVLALLGSRAPATIKLLLVTIAIIDDIGAVVIIALFYTADLNLSALAAGGIILAGMFALNRAGVRQLWPFLAGLALLWIAIFNSGVHATIAGVLTALVVPLGLGEQSSPVKRLEHAIHPAVMLAIVPLFGFASAGVTISGFDSILSPLPLGVALGLFLGKQIGVFGAVWLADRTGIAPKPETLSWWHIYAGALLCGVGFTMSLFIGHLAFSDPELVDSSKIGTLVGSVLAIAATCAVLWLTGGRVGEDQDRDEAEEVFGRNFDTEPCLDPQSPLPGRPNSLPRGDEDSA